MNKITAQLAASVTYRVIYILEHSGERLDQIGRNIGYEPYGVGIENSDAVGKASGVHCHVQRRKQLVAWLH